MRRDEEQVIEPVRMMKQRTDSAAIAGSHRLHLLKSPASTAYGQHCDYRYGPAGQRDREKLASSTDSAVPDGLDGECIPRFQAFKAANFDCSKRPLAMNIDTRA